MAGTAVSHAFQVFAPEPTKRRSACAASFAKVLHTDFRAARDKLNELGIETPSGGVTKVDVPVASIEAVAEKIRGVKAGTEGTSVADTPSTDAGSVYGWFLEAGSAGYFEKASDAFRKAAAIVDRLADLGNS